jgi:hypothetical protein
MQITKTTIAKSLHKAYQKQNVDKNKFDAFRDNLALLFSKINEKESEKYLKNGKTL